MIVTVPSLWAVPIDELRREFVRFCDGSKRFRLKELQSF